MKKQLLIFSSFLVGIFSVNAQITITSADVAIPVKTIYQSTDTLMTSGAIVGSAGVSQTWNMTALTTGKVDTLTFMPYWWAPNVKFSTSNLVVKSGWQQQYIYLINASTGLTSLGSALTTDFGSGFVTVNQINSVAEILMDFPGTYNTAYTNNFTTTTPAFHYGKMVSGFTVDSIRMKSVVKKTVLVDAWGTLTTPLGTYNVIRSKETVIKHDTTDACILSLGGWDPAPGVKQISADSTTGYSWWANGVGFPLVTMNLDSAGALKQVQWLQTLPLAGINEYTAKENVTVYPNPAQNEINFGVDASKVSFIQILDITGRMVNSFTVSSNNSVINTSDFANGAYLFTVLGKDKTILNHGKFTVAK